MQTLTRRDSKKFLLPVHKTHKRKSSGDKTAPHRYGTTSFSFLENIDYAQRVVIILVSLVFLTWVIFFDEQPTSFDHPDHDNNAIIDGKEFDVNPKPSIPGSGKSPILKAHNHDLPHKIPTYDELDISLCGYSPCKFLFPVWISEQESRAQYQLQQIALLAGKLNRTVVLPNVQNSKLGACLKFPFNNYYDIKKLTAFSEHFRFVTQQQFEDWVLNRGEDVAAQFVLLFPSPKKPAKDWSPPAPPIFKLDRTYCGSDFAFDYKHYNTLAYAPRYGYAKSKNNLIEMRNNLISVLSNSHQAKGHTPRYMDETAPVQLLIYELPDPFMEVPIPGPPFTYIQSHYRRVMEVVQSLRPFIVVHWRMEKVKSTNLPVCAVRLAARLRKLKILHNITNVYLATDFPLENKDKPHSTTWSKKLITQDHNQAIQTLRQAVDFTSWMDLQEKRRIATVDAQKKAALAPDPSEKVLQPKQKRAIQDDEPIDDEEEEEEGYEEDEPIDEEDAQVVEWDENEVKDFRGNEIIDDNSEEAANNGNFGLEWTDDEDKQEPYDLSLTLPPEDDERLDDGQTEESRDFDYGMIGIYDKLVSMHADVFISGSVGCAKISAFTNQIVEARIRGLEIENGYASNNENETNDNDEDYNEDEGEEDGENEGEDENNYNDYDDNENYEDDNLPPQPVLRNIIDQW